MINKVIIIGNLAADPSTRYTQSGSAVCNFTVATTTGRGDYEHTEWVKCVAFGKLAEICGEYLQKGKKVYVEGTMKTRKWEDRDGNNRYTTEIQLDVMKMLSGNDGSSQREPEPNDNQKMEDDVPF